MDGGRRRAGAAVLISAWLRNVPQIIPQGVCEGQAAGPRAWARWLAGACWPGLAGRGSLPPFCRACWEARSHRACSYQVPSFAG